MMVRRSHIKIAVSAAMLAGLLAPLALAQEIIAPRYEALEQQQQMLEQRGLDTLERQRVDEMLRPPSSSPADSTAMRALRQLDIQRRQDDYILQGQQERAQVQRERMIADTLLPNRRIAPSSILVVSQPELYGLARLPAGKYYARLDGRFVVVDRASELVESVLPVQPTDPTADVPQGARPPLLPAVPLAPAPRAN